jgi:hypothetical protein
MKESPAKGVLFWTVLLLTVWAVWWNLQSLLLTAVAAGMLLGSLTSFYLPTVYRLGADGAGYSRWLSQRKLEWSRVRSVTKERDGVFLSPFPAKTRLENFRGLYLPYRSNREEVLACIRLFAPEATGLTVIKS